MRQVFNVRFLAAVAALAGLALLVNTVVADEEPLEAILEEEVVPRRIDLVEAIFVTIASDDFEIQRDGTTVGFIDMILNGNRVLRVAPGTPGVIECEQLTEINRCAVFADLLGDAVVWFAIMPQAESATVELPPIIDLEGGYAIFENGWQILYPPVIERDCGNEDIPSFSDFLRRFGPNSVSIVDLEVQQVTTVRCGVEVVPSTTVPGTDAPATSIEPGGGVLDIDGPLQAPTSVP